MKRFLVTRHVGTTEWLSRQGILGEVVANVDHELLERLEPGDTVYGNLPAPMVAEVCAQGARYFHIVLPRLDIGGELDADAMMVAGARLQEVRAWVPSPKFPSHAGRRGFAFIPFALLFGAITFAGMAINLSYDLLGLAWNASLIDRPRLLLLSTVALMIAIGIAWIAWNWKGRLLQFSVQPLHVLPKYRAVVVGLSPLRDADIQIEAMQFFSQEELAMPTNEFRELASRNHEVGHVNAASNPWQQVVRLIHSQLPDLDLIVVVLSRGHDGSHDQFVRFQSLMSSVFPNRPTILPSPAGPVDFNDHDAVRAAIRTSVRFAEKQGAILPPDVAVDVTAGTKIFSFAASGVTANTDAGMLYVTNGGDVIAYDAVAAISEA